MVCSGVPEKNDHHAAEVSKMGLDLLAKVYEIYKWAKMLEIVKQIGGFHKWRQHIFGAFWPPPLPPCQLLSDFEHPPG